ncbi:hypothetical protein O6H91_03G093700 [Diphasiastrum complanatum]|uniref:Uncharacterized protein n=1 Tax=Diphasiastrum complanatum TaxID=34168 RepID=A0ACC2E9I9_DIPCM|nr:hypothetical protein O6H91_03G093700 [Diphasiastrum complanatum]
MNDLFTKSFTEVKARRYVDLKRGNLPDLEAGEGTEMTWVGGMEHNLAGFNEEVDGMKKGMEKIKQLLGKLQAANEDSKTVTKAQAMKALRTRMQTDVEEVLKLAKSTKVKLEGLDRSNKANRKLPGCEEGTPTDVTRISITNTLRKMLKDLMGDFQILRQNMMGEYRETIKRRYFTITGQHPDENTIEQIIETGESENFLQKAIQEQGKGQIIDIIAEIQERHDAVMEIEKNLLELHKILLDMAVLVEDQGEHLDEIEQQVYKASANVEMGANHLHDAKKNRKSLRKCLCMGIMLLFILIILIIIPVVAARLKKP